MLENVVEEFLLQYNLFGNNILVALSGGYDSLCLLNVLKKMQKKYEFTLTAIHLNHGWRGEESDREEINCKNFCDGIGFYSEKLSDDVPHTETAARDARYDFFKKCAKKFNSNVVLTAHNANDNAETVFYRLTKGTGIKGLEGISEHRDIFYRPLLTVYRDEIEKYCKENNLTPNIDSSNFDTKFARNKIRNEIFPQILETSPDFVKNLNALSYSANQFGKSLGTQLKDLEAYPTKEFCDLNTFFQTSVVHKFFRDNGLDYDRKTIEKIVNFINDNKSLKSGKKISLTKNLWLFVNSERIEKITEIAKNYSEVKITKEGEYPIGDFIFEITKVTKTPEKFPKDEDFEALVNLKTIDFTLRTRKDGDIVQPLGSSGTQKLKKYFNAKKVPNHKKDEILLLCHDNEVFWVAGYGVSDKIKVESIATHRIRLKKDKR